jgi:hypothetical protein
MVVGVDVYDLGAARGPGNQADGAAADAERIGHRGQRGLGRLAVDGPLAHPDDQGAVMLAADTWKCRAGLHPNSDPHADSIDVGSRSGRLRRSQAGSPANGLASAEMVLSEVLLGAEFMAMCKLSAAPTVAAAESGTGGSLCRSPLLHGTAAPAAGSRHLGNCCAWTGGGLLAG